MSDTVQGVSGASPAAAADSTAADNAALSEAFQAAVLNGALFMMGTAQPDNMEDATSDPDAPF